MSMHVNKEKSPANEVLIALYTVNCHAKTAEDPKELYRLKYETLQKLLKSGQAQKIGLHFSGNSTRNAQSPKNASMGLGKQNSVVIIESGDYRFHIPASSEDLKSLPHLGEAVMHQNKKDRISIFKAKKILYNFTKLEPQTHAPKQSPKQYFTSSNVFGEGFTFETENPFKKKYR